MQTQRSLLLLLFCCLAGSKANRVYVHPFYLFAAENVSCETLQTSTVKDVRTVPVDALSLEVLSADSRNFSEVDTQKQNITTRTAVLAQLLNALGLRMYQSVSSQHPNSNSLFSPVNTFGSLVNFYLGASKKTAGIFLELLGLSSGTDREDCVSLVDGHKVLQTLQNINSLVDDGPKDEIVTQVWAFIRHNTQLSEDFVQGTKDFSDKSFIRGVDFSKPEEAEQLINSFVEKTSGEKVKDIFKDVNASSDFLFLSSFLFQGSWKTAFQPENTSMQEFHVDEANTVTAPMMTHTGQYLYLNDKMRKCTIVKLPLSKRSNMLLVRPHDETDLHEIESKLLTDVISGWYQDLKEGLLELSIPKFSMTSTTDLRDLLHSMDPVIESKVLGSQADFSQLSNTKPFTIDKIVNKVLFEMSEEGHEPQDTTEEAGIPLKVSFNKPFFFSVVEENSGSILMLGKITNPSL
ncbi:angiotensinogen [Gouania willdenowi]|uniref:Angiotensinogen n=1 Tax=Gouania willdenowi TaxID=441366 RepID=A0A8C5GNH7_GOUWI|nr:angiotensinogen [Gouania willdenowi]